MSVFDKTPPSTVDKQVLRKEMLARRQAMSAGEVENRSLKVFEVFKASEHLLLPQSYRSVAFYFPVKGEVDTRPFFKFFANRKKTCLFPRMENGGSSGPGLSFYEVKDWAELQLGAYGIGEPLMKAHAQPHHPDLVFVPGVAFSAHCDRIGFGAGFYDRTADAWRQSGERERMRLIGLAYDFQIVPAIDKQAHDQPMDFVVTDAGIHKILSTGK